MATTIIKPQRDVDFYAIHSSMTDTITLWGTRAELEPSLDSNSAERFERADTYGDSSMLRGYTPGWNDSVEVNPEDMDDPTSEGRWNGTIRHADLPELIESFDPSCQMFRPRPGLIEWTS